MESIQLNPILGAVLRVYDPGSPEAHAIAGLGLITTIVLTAIFVLVGGAIVYALMRFRWREGEADPRQIAGNKKLEMIWTAIPAVIVIVLFALTARTMNLSDPPPAAEPDLVVVGHQWWWEARYPKSGAVVANEIHIPTGKGFSIRLDSADVLHEFWVPELGRKISAVPGHPNHLWIQSDRPGTFLGLCTEFCGTQHAWMHFLVVVQPQAEFDAWEKAQLQPAAMPTTGAAAEGYALFQRDSCVNCHAVNGSAAKAVVGPDLTHFAGRQQLAAGVVTNSPENLRLWLANPQQIKPGVLMPNFNFTDEQLNQLVAYFETLK